MLAIRDAYQRRAVPSIRSYVISGVKSHGHSIVQSHFVAQFQNRKNRTEHEGQRRCDSPHGRRRSQLWEWTKH